MLLAQLTETRTLVIILAGSAVVLAILVFVLFRLLFSRPAEGQRAAVPMGVDIGSLEARGPVADGPRLHVYGTPVHLAVVVIAPAGRAGVIPSLAQIPDVLDQLVPGMANIVQRQQPVVRIWRSQLSSQGFTQSFFNLVALPGDRGKGTPWCSIAGKFEGPGQPLLVGLVGSSAAANGLGQIAVQHEGQWLDVLRVQDSPS